MIAKYIPFRYGLEFNDEILNNLFLFNLFSIYNYYLQTNSYKLHFVLHSTILINILILLFISDPDYYLIADYHFIADYILISDYLLIDSYDAIYFDV